MQAKLHPAEFAYLLQMLDAQKVVGVNNAEFFPDDAAARDTLLKLGFSKLQEHGWFVSTDGKIRANNRLVLLAAVVANPELVLTATYFAADDSRRSITYYSAGELVIEQFLAADGDYLLAQLESMAMLESRLAEAFVLPDEHDQAQTALAFDGEIFEQVLHQARAGDLAPLAALLAGQVTAEALDRTVQTISQLQPAGKIEAAAIAGQRLQEWNEFAILRDNAGQQWLAHRDARSNALELAPATKAGFEQHLRQLLRQTG